MGGSLFVTHVDYTNTFIEATVININNVTATEREYGIDALGFERLRDQMTARDDRAIPGFRR
jgi:hypothetical protein